MADSSNRTCGAYTSIIGADISNEISGELKVQFNQNLGSKIVNVHLYNQKVIISAKFLIGDKLILTQSGKLRTLIIPPSVNMKSLESLYFQTGKILLIGLNKDLNIVGGLLWKKSNNYIELPSLKTAAENTHFIVRKDPVLNDSFYFQSHGPNAVTI